MDTTPESIIYPIGHFSTPESFVAADVKNAIEDIAVLPRLLDYCIENLDEAHLHHPYREGGWTINQIIHHIADSHMNAYVRCKLAVTEDNPVVKPYEQELWALTADVRDVAVNYSVTLVHALHYRWVKLLQSLDETGLQRTFFHSDSQSNVPLWEMAQKYAWHGRHHVAQVRGLRERMEW
jgi:hypothetical protein